MAGRVLRGAGLAIALISLALAARVSFVAYGPRPAADQLAAQVRFLQNAIRGGAGPRMQQLFPEGDFFLTALTASAAAGAPDPDLSAVRALRDDLDAPDTVAIFGSGMVPEHGIFQAGWSLMVAADLAEASRDPGDRADVERRAEVVDAAFRGSRTGFLEGYPRQFWPCDSVVAAAGLARAAELVNRPEWLTSVRRWRNTISAEVDPATGLLPHRVDAAGLALEGPRGSSQSIIQAFWPAIDVALDGVVDQAGWSRFRRTFVVREAGLVGVREFPRGRDQVGDVDSGPLVLGVSASASVVTLAAARQVGDTDLAAALDREAELLGLPTTWGRQRRYALGLLPVGDAFVAWARSRPAGPSEAPDPPDPPDPPSSPARPLWPVFIAVVGSPALVAGGLLLRRRATRLRP